LMAVTENPPPRLKDLTCRGSVVHVAFHTFKKLLFPS